MPPCAWQVGARRRSDKFAREALNVSEQKPIIHRLFNGFAICNLAMTMLFPFLILVAAPGLEPDQHRSEQARAYEETRQGRILSPRIIESRVIPTMKDYQYLGFDLDFGSGIYTLKFLRDGTVVWVEVDGHSGQILGRTGK